ncbi:MAG: hypothetical protein K0R21_1291 [Anaerocolumna sp.]|jgi:DNA-binding transcriptional LysR family regulator|nr:hypothetical protein [Anaerocolumna sp.]
MTLRHIKIFVAVCDCESITAAAEKLYIAQPSVSLVIRELEDYYGVKLFDRISRKLYLTEPGKSLLNYARHIVSLFEDMEKEIRNENPTGILRIGASITIGQNLLPGYVKQFMGKYPHRKIQVMIHNSEEIEQSVLKNEIDFGLIEGITHSPQIHSEKFMEDELVLICSKNHPLASNDKVMPEMLSHYGFILREKGSGGRELFDSTMLTHNIEINPIWESVSTRAIISAVSADIGLSVLPYLLVKKDLESGNIKTVKIEGIAFGRNFNIIYHKNKYHTKTAMEFMDICRKG